MLLCNPRLTPYKNRHNSTVGSCVPLRGDGGTGRDGVARAGRAGGCICGCDMVRIGEGMARRGDEAILCSV